MMIKSLIKKEAIHIVRDRRTMLITLLMPVVLLILFGFAISTEVNNIDVVVTADRQNEQLRDIAKRLDANPYVTFLGIGTLAEADALMVKGDADAIVCINGTDGNHSVQIIADASNPTTAQSATAYIQAIISDTRNPRAPLTHTLYNPQLKSAYNFVPGIMGLIFLLVCAIMTSVSIVGEKEDGTMNLLLVSPVRPSTIIAGKLIPYFILSAIILMLMLTISYTLLGLPLTQSVVGVVILSLIYIMLSLSIGLLVSTIADTRMSALVISAVLFMLPVIMLSGMIFPIDNMPRPLQWFSCIIPARWYTEALRKVMIQQISLRMVWREVAILLSMTAVILSLALKKLKS